MRVFGAQNGSGLERGSPGASLEAQPFPQTPPGLTASGVVGSAGSVGSLTPAQVYSHSSHCALNLFPSRCHAIWCIFGSQGHSTSS